MTVETEVEVSDKDAQMIEEIRTILTFLTENMTSFTELFTDKAYLKKLRDYVSVWRWYVSHTYFEKDTKFVEKPPISWLHNLLVAHRSVASCVSLLATPGLTWSTDAKNAADILMLKLGRIQTYAAPKEVPKTFYLPPSDPKKTDQEGIAWAKSKSKGAKKYRKVLRAQVRAIESLEPKPPYEKTDKELKEYLAAKKERREFERKTRADIDKELVRMAKTEKRRGERRP